MAYDDRNDYHKALEAAGANVLAFKDFGSYQGDWFAKVEHEGETFWLHDYYGSCSGCDAFQADIGWEPWDDDPIERAGYDAKVAAFGKRYLEPQERLTYDQALKCAGENSGWDSNAADMMKFVLANA